MKKILSLLTSIFFSAFLVLSLLPNAFAANTSMQQTALPSSDSIITSSKRYLAATTMPIYKINGANYFKLRDIGFLMDFSVKWNSQKKCIEINTASPSDGSQVSTQRATSTVKATRSYQPVYIDYILHDDLTVYNINNNNYFQLRDLAQILNFYCDYSVENHYVYISNHQYYDGTITPIGIESFYKTYRESKYAPDFGAKFDLEPTFQYNTMYFYNKEDASQYVDQYRTILSKCGFTQSNDGLDESYYLIVGNHVPVMISLSYTDVSFRIMVTTSR